MSPALERLLLVGCSVSVPIFSSIGAIRAGKAAAAAAAAFFYRGQRLEVLNVSLYAAVAAGIFGRVETVLFFRRFRVFSLFLVVAWTIL